MRKFQLGIAALVVVGLTLVLLAGNGFFDFQDKPRQVDLQVDDGEDEQAPKQQAKPDREDERVVEIGGIERPARDLNFDQAISKDPALPKSIYPDPGRAPFLKGDENEQVARLLQEVSNPRGPTEALSTYKLARDFDLEAYRKDPQSYLSKTRPGRVNEPAQPTERVVRIATDMPYYHSLLQGESLNLRAQVTPGMPVTFHAQLGEFSNRLKTQTVAADENGIARARYQSGPGTVGPTEILAASPVHSGQLRFIVDVSLPDNAAEAGGN